MSANRNFRVILVVVATLALYGVLLLATVGYAEESVRATVRITAKIGVVLFCGAFVAAPLRILARGRLGAWLLARRRGLGISLGIAHATHVAALGALAISFPDPFLADIEIVPLVLGGLVSALVFVMALTSSDRAQRALGMPNWRRLHTFGSYSIWITFTQSYVPRAFEDPAYAPFALLLIATFGLRIGRIAQRRRTERARVAA